MRVQSGLLALLLAVFLGSAALAQQAAAPTQDLAGVWQGKMQVDKNTAMTVQFTFTKKPDGTYSAVLNSSDNADIRDVPANPVTWKAGALTVQVPSLSGSFAGALSGGSISGQWKQPGSTLPLVLTPYLKPQLSKAAVATLQGSWNGRLGIPQPDLTFLIEFKPDDKGQLTASLTFAEQPVKVPPISDIQFADNKLVMNVQMPGTPGQFTGTYANGTLTGVWRAGTPLAPPAGVPLVLKKGVYVAQVHVLKLSAESFGLVAGSWKGELHVTTPKGPVTLPVVLRFETNKNAEMVGFMESPSQSPEPMAVTEATLTAGKLVVTIAGVGAEYDATLAGNSLTGNFKQGPGSLPLVMTRK